MGDNFTVVSESQGFRGKNMQNVYTILQFNSIIHHPLLGKRSFWECRAKFYANKLTDKLQQDFSLLDCTLNMIAPIFQGDVKSYGCSWVPDTSPSSESGQEMINVLAEEFAKVVSELTPTGIAKTIKWWFRGKSPWSAADGTKNHWLPQK